MSINPPRGPIKVPVPRARQGAEIHGFAADAREGASVNLIEFDDERVRQGQKHSRLRVSWIRRGACAPDRAVAWGVSATFRQA